jgi:lipoprotein-releasing system ATP-binding protein
MNKQLEKKHSKEDNVLPLRTESILSAISVGKTFHQAGKELNVLQDVELKLDPGEMVALVGPSGSGKSTLLQILGLLDTPTTGEIYIDGVNAGSLKDRERTFIRRKFIGFIYQFHHLLPEFTALENVMLPQIIAGTKRKTALNEAERLLVSLGLQERLDHRPARLSGGEQQRVAIARALANKPKLVLADEPTGNLDPETSEEVFAMLLNLVQEENIAALIATHNMDLADKMDRILELKNGSVLAF